MSERKTFLKIKGLHGIAHTSIKVSRNPGAPILDLGHEILSLTGFVFHVWGLVLTEAGASDPRTPRSYSPSLSSVCVLSWSCVFLCSFYVSLFAEPLFAEPQVSDEHLKYTCNIHVNYKGKYKG